MSVVRYSVSLAKDTALELERRRPALVSRSRYIDAVLREHLALPLRPWSDRERRREPRR